MPLLTRLQEQWKSTIASYSGLLLVIAHLPLGMARREVCTTVTADYSVISS